MIWTTCKYAPMEMFAGLGEQMERLDPHPENFSCADSCGHPNLCSFVKAVMEEIQAKKIKELVLTDCCDSTRRLYDLLQASGEMDFLWFLPFPHKHGQRETDLFEKELRKLCHAYENYKHRTFDEETAIADYHRRQKAFPVRPGAPYLRLTGAHGGSYLQEQMQKIFAPVPVVDDTCTGNRYLRGNIQEGEDFFRWYASVLLEQDMGCFRMWKNGGRTPENAEIPSGTVYHTVKFCDYYGFEYMLEKEEAAGPLLKIETDATPKSSGQLKTRLEAFREEIGLAGEETMTIPTTEKIYTAGIDSGSASTDAVIMDEERHILGRAILATGSAAASGAGKALEMALQEAGLAQKDLTSAVTTGYGRDSLGIPCRSVTEITCHAKGAHFLDPAARTVIDIGGQDSKIICMDENGMVKNFVMNDKCAAGTGRFLEMQARAMELSMEEMSRLGLEWKQEVTISSMCTVFAESEVVSLVADNVPAADIIHGLNMSIAQKTASLAARMKTEPEYIMTGGVARNRGVVECLQERLGQKIFVHEDAQLCGAIGAALIALESIQKDEKQ